MKSKFASFKSNPLAYDFDRRGFRKQDLSYLLDEALEDGVFWVDAFSCSSLIIASDVA